MEMTRFSEGWQEQEYRWKTFESMQLRPATSLPQWGGQKPSRNERLLVFEEQGFGDKLQFCRYLVLAAEQFTGGVSIVIGSPLRELFRRSFPKVEILDAMPVDQSAWQWQCPLLSLPLAFGTTLETIPKQTPYLIAGSGTRGTLAGQNRCARITRRHTQDRRGMEVGDGYEYCPSEVYDPATHCAAA